MCSARCAVVVQLDSQQSGHFRHELSPAHHSQFSQTTYHAALDCRRWMGRSPRPLMALPGWEVSAAHHAPASPISPYSGESLRGGIVGYALSESSSRIRYVKTTFRRSAAFGDLPASENAVGSSERADSTCDRVLVGVALPATRSRRVADCIQRSHEHGELR